MILATYKVFHGGQESSSLWTTMFGGDVRRWKEAAVRARQAPLAHLGDPLYES